MKLIDLLTEEVRSSAHFNSNVQVAPSVILWTDKLRQWESALPLLQAAMPELVVLGDYAPDQKRGPAIWIKCVIEGVLPELQLPAERTPILYLPGIERRDLRAIADCPDELKPLAELQYRGCWWIYNNSGRDWTVNAFLISSNGGANLDVAKDEASQQAMLRVLTEILESERDNLAGRRLEAPDFNKLVSSDPVRDLLTWMNDPKAARDRWDQARWTALVGICESEYRFHPEQDGELVAAELLCLRQGAWESIWQRYEESCHHYPKLPTLLLRVEPDLAADGASYPAINAIEEKDLEQALGKLVKVSADEARQGIIQLEKRHAARRSWIWASLGMAPLANLLLHLVKVAEGTSAVFSGRDAEDMAEQYLDRFWSVDDELLRVLASCSLQGNHGAIQDLLALVYTPWLEAVTRNFQRLVLEKGYPGTNQINEATATYAAGGEVVFFVDGLRFDLGLRLKERLCSRGEVKLSTNWAALPSVTATAKAAVTPVHDRLTGRDTDLDFNPSLKEADKQFSAYYLRKYLEEKDWAYLEEGDAGSTASNAWVQSGDIDKEGHVKGLKLAARVDGLLEEVVERVDELLAAGWNKIRIVTDHGWLLLPHTMTKVELPKHLTETRWGRCAVLREAVDSGYPQVGWYWNSEVSIAMAPGVSSFRGGLHYDHGGLSLQECLTPVIEIKNTLINQAVKQVEATLSEVRWLGFNCRVKAETEAEGVMAVLRTHPADPDTELCKRKPLKDGKCSLMVDDDLEGATAVLVLLDADGRVLAKKPTLIGEE